MSDKDAGVSRSQQTNLPDSPPPTRWARLCDWGESVALPWGTFLKVVGDPYTFLLIALAAILGIFGPKAVGENYNSVMQAVIAVVTGVVGARISTAMAAINQEGKLYSNGRMAVRGLRLIFTRTLALEKRVAGFLDASDGKTSHEAKAAVAHRNLDEVLESVRALQLDVAGAIDNWVDVVPNSDVSNMLLMVGELRDQITEKDSQLNAAISEKEYIESQGSRDSESLQAAKDRIAELERDKAILQKQASAVKRAATQELTDKEINGIFPRPLTIRSATLTPEQMGARWMRSWAEIKDSVVVDKDVRE